MFFGFKRSDRQYGGDVSNKHIVKRRVPKQQRSKEKVKRILDSAEYLMAELGTESVNTHQVAAHACIAVGTLYQFFKNIEMIKIALVERAMNLFHDKTISKLKGATSVKIAEVFILLIDASIDFYHQHPDSVRSLLVSRNSKAFYLVNNRLSEELIKELLNLIRKHHLDAINAEIEQKIRILVSMSEAMSKLVWTAASEKERDVFIAEWKFLTNCYTKTLLVQCN